MKVNKLTKDYVYSPINNCINGFICSIPEPVSFGLKKTSEKLQKIVSFDVFQVSEELDNLSLKKKNISYEVGRIMGYVPWGLFLSEVTEYLTFIDKM